MPRESRSVPLSMDLSILDPLNLDLKGGMGLWMYFVLGRTTILWRIPWSDHYERQAEELKKICHAFYSLSWQAEGTAEDKRSRWRRRTKIWLSRSTITTEAVSSSSPRGILELKHMRRWSNPIDLREWSMARAYLLAHTVTNSASQLSKAVNW